MTEFLACVDAEFGENVTKVPFNGSRADKQLGRDFGVGTAAGSQASYLCLLGSQLREGIDGTFPHGYPTGEKLAPGPLSESVGTDVAEQVVSGA